MIRKSVLMLAALAVLSSAAHAQGDISIGSGVPFNWAPTSQLVTDTSQYDIVVTEKSGNAIYDAFRMGPGGCLIGPLSFLDASGKGLFTLAPGAHYPEGCK